METLELATLGCAAIMVFHYPNFHARIYLNFNFKLYGYQAYITQNFGAMTMIQMVERDISECQIKLKRIFLILILLV